ncbi:co-chaperone DjlA [Thalassotalea aquiviva]|uniref:co-chaperone DjlA n=1 Tax=Thalassotalea aquiviva TaxID=3242415 RepID=UPI00352AFA67
MRIWGKVFGFLLGFMAGRILGALIGLYIGHKFDQGLSLDFNAFNRENDLKRQNVYFVATFSVMGHITKASGRVTENEIAFAKHAMHKWGLNSEMQALAKESFRVGKQSDFNLSEQLKKLRSATFGRHDLLRMFLEIQIQAAFADGELHPSEREILHKIARAFGMSAQELDFILDRIIAGEQFHQGRGAQSASQKQQHLENAYKVLGVTPNCDKQTVKKAYRKLMSQHHPDKLVAKGLPPELMEDAKQKAQDIQAAYELISQQG